MSTLPEWRTEDWIEYGKEDLINTNGSPFSLLNLYEKDYGVGYRKELDSIKERLIEILGVDPITITNDTIDHYVDLANTSELQEYFVYPVKEVEDPVEFIKRGFFPTSIDVSKKWFTDYLDGETVETLVFYNDEENIRTIVDRLPYELRWVYKSLNEWRRLALSNSGSIGLKLFAPELLYHKSKRPINSMDMFRRPDSYRINKRDVVNNKIKLDRVWNVIPVTRYAAGMSRGLFYGEAQTEFCGTFYYKEIESKTLLAFNTSYSSFNKYTMFDELMEYMEDLEPGIQERIINSDFYNLSGEERLFRQGFVFKRSNFHRPTVRRLDKYVEGNLPRDLMLTPMETYPYITTDQRTVIKLLPDKKYYAGSLLGLYAVEDRFDQALCILGKKLGFDILILENMVGSFQVVTEILDTRSREDSFKSLVYIV